MIRCKNNVIGGIHASRMPLDLLDNILAAGIVEV